MKFLALIPVWRRPEVVRICRDHLPEWLDVVWLVDPNDTENVEQLGKHKLMSYNHMPLGARLNSGLQHLRKIAKFDYLVNLGSDDILHPAYTDTWQELAELGVDVWGLDSVHVYDMHSGKAGRWSLPVGVPEVFGAGRCISVRALDALDWQLYNNTDERGLDTSSHRRLRRAGFETERIEMEYGCLDLKTNYNINPWAIVEGQLTEICDGPTILEAYGVYYPY